ncbi:MAG TPA: hypothetical protein VKB84_00250 [Candidatus Binataceae bacterium]|nr:hypothetical protein [Candidatus Binataceae bacterium]
MGAKFLLDRQFFEQLSGTESTHAIAGLLAGLELNRFRPQALFPQP